MTQTQLAIFTLSAILVGFGPLYLLTRCLLLPRLRQVTHCPWCWQDAGIAQDFPAPWSSTICPYHHRQIRAQARARRQSLHLSTSAGPRLTKMGPVEEVAV
jgi:hypothetical protein